MWPCDATQPYFLLGCLSRLLAKAASNLGSPQAAEELARAGSAYATAIDHRPLLAHLRLLRTGALEESTAAVGPVLAFRPPGEP